MSEFTPTADDTEAFEDVIDAGFTAEERTGLDAIAEEEPKSLSTPFGLELMVKLDTVHEERAASNLEADMVTFTTKVDKYNHDR